MYLKRRRGVSGLVELVSVVVIFSLIIVAALSVMGIQNRIVIREQGSLSKQNDVGIVLDYLTQDVKSSREIYADGTTLTVALSDNTLVTYRYEARKILRNDEVMMSNMISASFDLIDENRVAILLYANDGTKIETTLHR